MRKIIMDLTKFDNEKLFDIYFDTIEKFDNYIFEKYGLKLDKNSSIYGARNYKGDYNYFANNEKIDGIETFAMLRTYINQYVNGYGISSFDFSYVCPLGWNSIGEQIKNINIIANNNSYKVRFRGNYAKN